MQYLFATPEAPQTNDLRFVAKPLVCATTDRPRNPARVQSASAKGCYRQLSLRLKGVDVRPADFLGVSSVRRCGLVEPEIPGRAVLQRGGKRVRRQQACLDCWAGPKSRALPDVVQPSQPVVPRFRHAAAIHLRGRRDFSLASGNLLRNRMDILYVGTLLPHEGGSGITSSLLLKGLVKLGHGVRAVAPIVAGAASREAPMRSWCPEIEVQRYHVPCYATDEVHTPVQPAYRDEERRQVRTLLLRLSKEKEGFSVALTRQKDGRSLKTSRLPDPPAGGVYWPATISSAKSIVA
jgi:hypothetical protein